MLSIFKQHIHTLAGEGLTVREPTALHRFISNARIGRRAATVQALWVAYSKGFSDGMKANRLLFEKMIYETHHVTDNTLAKQNGEYVSMAAATDGYKLSSVGLLYGFYMLGAFDFKVSRGISIGAMKRIPRDGSGLHRRNLSMSERNAAAGGHGRHAKGAGRGQAQRGPGGTLALQGGAVRGEMLVWSSETKHA